MSDQPSGSQSSGSQSSEGGQKDPTTIAFTMHKGCINSRSGVATWHLEMPSWEGRSNTQPDEYTPIQLEIKDEDQMGSLMRMRELQHENILAVHFFEKDGVGGIRAFFEPHTGFISDLFTTPGFFIHKDTRLVPSPVFQEIVRASLDGLDYIIRNGQYHGNFSWHTTVYVQGADGKRIVKLSNFEERKNKSLFDCQFGDCHALAHGLEEVSRRVKNDCADIKPETCLLIDDLASRLRAVTSIQSLRKMKQHNGDNVFFWDDKRKKSFYAYEIPALWDKPEFLERFRRSPSAPKLPWNTTWTSDDFMTEMEIYRKANGIKKYNFEEIKDFLRFICGLYTHQVELKVVQPTVDAAVHRKHPRLLFDLKTAAE